MTDQKTSANRKTRKLSHEILALLGVTFAISLFLFEFLSLTADFIVANYCYRHDLTLTHAQSTDLEIWIFTISLITTVMFFISLFLFLLGQKIAYIKNITKGIEALQASHMDFVMPLEGNNELTRLAETINYLSATQRQIKEKEKALSEEKEQLIRTLSHDIRTPLTSIMSYSEFLAHKEDLTPQEVKEHLNLIRNKAEQISKLTEILLDGGRRNPERFENARLLMEQLAAGAEEVLEDGYDFSVDLSQCPPFAGTFDIQELHRIFDNLISNIQKYANPQQPVTLAISIEENQLFIRQKNFKLTPSGNTESYQMGLNSIRRIAHNYNGTVEVRQDETIFAITIALSEI